MTLECVQLTPSSLIFLTDRLRIITTKFRLLSELHPQEALADDASVDSRNHFCQQETSFKILSYIDNIDINT